MNVGADSARGNQTGESTSANANGNANAEAARPSLIQGLGVNASRGSSAVNSTVGDTSSVINPVTFATSRPAGSSAQSAGSPTPPPTSTTATGPATAQSLNFDSSRAADADTQVNRARLSRTLTNAVQQRGGAVTLRLTPPEMGTVRIQLQLGSGNVSAQFHAETGSAQNLLHQQMGQLRHALEGQGLHVDRLSVHSTASTTANHASSQPNGGEQSASDGRSRGQYSQADQNDHQDPSQQHGDQAGPEHERGRDQTEQPNDRFGQEVEALMNDPAPETAQSSTA